MDSQHLTVTPLTSTAAPTQPAPPEHDSGPAVATLATETLATAHVQLTSSHSLSASPSAYPHHQQQNRSASTDHLVSLTATAPNAMTAASARHALASMLHGAGMGMAAPSSSAAAGDGEASVTHPPATNQSITALLKSEEAPALDGSPKEGVAAMLQQLSGSASAKVAELTQRHQELMAQQQAQQQQLMVLLQRGSSKKRGRNSPESDAGSGLELGAGAGEGVQGAGGAAALDGLTLDQLLEQQQLLKMQLEQQQQESDRLMAELQAVKQQNTPAATLVTAKPGRQPSKRVEDMLAEAANMHQAAQQAAAAAVASQQRQQQAGSSGRRLSRAGDGAATAGKSRAAAGNTTPRAMSAPELNVTIPNHLQPPGQPSGGAPALAPQQQVQQMPLQPHPQQQQQQQQQFTVQLMPASVLPQPPATEAPTFNRPSWPFGSQPSTPASRHSVLLADGGEPLFARLSLGSALAHHHQQQYQGGQLLNQPPQLLGYHQPSLPTLPEDLVALEGGGFKRNSAALEYMLTGGHRLQCVPAASGVSGSSLSQHPGAPAPTLVVSPRAPVYPQPEATQAAVLTDKDLFTVCLKRLHDALGSRFRVPVVGGQELDLWMLYKQVVAHDGLAAVVHHKRWADVCAPFNFPTTFTSRSYTMRKLYSQILWHFEQVYMHNATGPLLPAPAPDSNSNNAMLTSIHPQPAVAATAPASHLAKRSRTLERHMSLTMSDSMLGPPPQLTPSAQAVQPQLQQQLPGSGGALHHLTPVVTGLGSPQAPVMSEVTLARTSMLQGTTSAAAGAQQLPAAPTQLPAGHPPFVAMRADSAGGLDTLADVKVGDTFQGVVTKRFDCGFFVQLQLGGAVFQGVLYAPPALDPQPPQPVQHQSPQQLSPHHQPHQSPAHTGSPAGSPTGGQQQQLQLQPGSTAAVSQQQQQYQQQQPAQADSPAEHNVSNHLNNTNHHQPPHAQRSVLSQVTFAPPVVEPHLLPPPPSMLLHLPTAGKAQLAAADPTAGNGEDQGPGSMVAVARDIGFMDDSVHGMGAAAALLGVGGDFLGLPGQDTLSTFDRNSLSTS